MHLPIGFPGGLHGGVEDLSDRIPDTNVALLANDHAA